MNDLASFNVLGLSRHARKGAKTSLSETGANVNRARTECKSLLSQINCIDAQLTDFHERSHCDQLVLTWLQRCVQVLSPMTSSPTDPDLCR